MKNAALFSHNYVYYTNYTHKDGHLVTNLSQLSSALLVCNKQLTTCKKLHRVGLSDLGQGCPVGALTKQCFIALSFQSCYSLIIPHACYKLLTACSKLVPTTWNKQYKHNLSTPCEQTCFNLFAVRVKQLVCSVRVYTPVALLSHLYIVGNQWFSV